MTAPGPVDQGQRSWTRSAIAELLAQKLNWPTDRCAAIIHAVTTAIGEALGKHRDVVIDEFAKLRTVSRGGQPGATFSVPSSEFNQPIAEKFNLKPSEIEGFTRGFFSTLRERLIANDKLKIDDFLALKVSDEKAKIIEDAISGQRVIAGAKKIISFMAHPAFKQLMGGQDISFVPMPQLKDGVESIKTATMVLVFPQRDFFVETVEFHFKRAGWKVLFTTNADDVAKLFTPGSGPYLAVIDAGLEGWAKLVEQIKTNRQTAMTPVIVTLPSADLQRPKEFRVMADQFIAQPFETKTLLQLAEAELQRATEEQIIFDQVVNFQFPTTDENIDRANEMAAQLFAKSGLDEEGQVALCAAFREGLGNAAQHGNKHRRDKNIDVMYILDKDKITLVICDEGKGFDWRLYVDENYGKTAVEKARARHRQGKLGGLGIMLILKCTDRIEYNEQGNTLTEYKMLVSAKK